MTKVITTDRLPFSSLGRMIGNTPLIRISFRYREGRVRYIYAKCENFNLTGSIKDRMALYILQKAYLEKKISPGDKIVEASSGNTGISFAAIGKALGHPVKIIMPDWLSLERRAIIKSMGAEVQLVSKEEGGFLGSINQAERSLINGNTFLPRQFENTYNCEAHEQTTGPEIMNDLLYTYLTPDAFVAGVGTAGTVMGVGNYLRSVNPGIKIFPLEPAESPTLSTGFKIGTHRIQGISDEFIPAIIDLKILDKVLQVNDGDAILMAQKLAAQLGLGVGISSGANLLGAIKAQETMTYDAVVVTVFSDSNKKYLSTDLVKEEPVREDYLSPEIELISYTPISRH